MSALAQAYAAAAIVDCIIELRIPLNVADANDRDFTGKLVIEGLTTFNMGGHLLIRIGGDCHPFWWLDADINIFGKPIDDAQTLRNRCPALEFERQSHLLQAVKALHDPAYLAPIQYKNEEWIILHALSSNSLTLPPACFGASGLLRHSSLRFEPMFRQRSEPSRRRPATVASRRQNEIDSTVQLRGDLHGETPCQTAGKDVLANQHVHRNVGAAHRFPICCGGDV